MSLDIVGAEISASGAIIVALVGNILSNLYLKNKFENDMRSVNKSLDSLTKRVDKHNGYSEKFAQMNSDLKNINNRMIDTREQLKITTLRIDRLLEHQEKMKK
jgi:uncharacterized membrane-anchored protein YhcB (DUF1043 family)